MGHTHLQSIESQTRSAVTSQIPLDTRCKSRLLEPRKGEQTICTTDTLLGGFCDSFIQEFNTDPKHLFKGIKDFKNPHPQYSNLRSPIKEQHDRRLWKAKFVWHLLCKTKLKKPKKSIAVLAKSSLDVTRAQHSVSSANAVRTYARVGRAEPADCTSPSELPFWSPNTSLIVRQRGEVKLSG